MANEQRKYIQSIVNPSSSAPLNPFDTNQGDTGEGEKDLVDLPFRFTQWKLNPGEKAASGEWNRTASPRSPATSGSLANELAGINSQLTGMAGDQAGLKYGMPTKDYEVPSNMILGKRNPIEAAQAFESKYKTPEERAAFGPTSTIQGYDVDALMKSSGWGGNLTEKYQGDENRSTQTFFRNLGLIPASFDPNMYSNNTRRNLVSQDFTYNRQPIPYNEPEQSFLHGGEGEGGNVAPTQDSTAMSDEEWSQQFNFGQPGEEGTVGKAGFGEFERQTQETIAKELHNGSAVTSVAHKYGLAATMAVMAAMSAGAASALFAPAAGAAGATGGGAGGAAAGGAGGSAASGLAGVMGMEAGFGATAVNTLATTIAKYGVTAAAQMAGVPVDNPMFQMALAAAGGAYSGATSAPTGVEGAAQGSPQSAVTGSDFVRGDINMGGLDTPQTSMVSAPDYSMSEGMTTPRNVFANDSGYIPGAEQGGINYKNLSKQAGEFGIKAGMKEMQANAAEQATEQTEDAAIQAEQAQYEEQVRQYEAERAALETRQSGVRQQIQSLIEGNPEYHGKQNYTGVQGALWR